MRVRSSLNQGLTVCPRSTSARALAAEAAKADKWGNGYRLPPPLLLRRRCRLVEQCLEKLGLGRVLSLQISDSFDAVYIRFTYFQFQVGNVGRGEIFEAFVA